MGLMFVTSDGLMFIKPFYLIRYGNYYRVWVVENLLGDLWADLTKSQPRSI